MGGSSSQPPVALASFRLNISATSAYVPIGYSSSSLQVSINPNNGFSDPVTVSVSNMPAGVTTTPASPMTVNAGSAQTVVFNAAATTPAGVQTVTFTATSGSLTDVRTLTLSAAKPSYVFAEVADTNTPPSDWLVTYLVDANTGALMEGAVQRVLLPSVAQIAIIPGPTRTFLAALVFANKLSPDIQLINFAIDPATGALAHVATVDFGSDTSPSSIGVDPAGKFLYVVRSNNCAYAYIVDPVTGNLTQASCSGDPTIYSVVLLPPGDYAYSIDINSHQYATIATYAVDRNDGSLANIEIVNYARGGYLYANPLGNAIYLVSPFWFVGPCDGSVQTFTINPGDPRISAASESYFLGINFYSIEKVSLDPTGKFGFIPALGVSYGRCPGGGIASFVLDASTGAYVSQMPGVSTPVAWTAVEPTQAKYVLAWQADPTWSLVTFPFDSTTPALISSPAGSVTLSAGWSFAEAISVAPK